jgi:type I restriction enzyme S subunit
MSEKVMVGIASAATHAYRNRGIILFRNQNIKPNFLDDSDVLHVTEEYEILFKGKRLKGGDLLTARTGYPGTTCVVPDKYENSQSFTTLITRPIQSIVLSSYLSYYINSEQGNNFFERSKIGGGQKNVNAGILKFMPIPLPPTLTEQKAIAHVLSDMDAEIAQLEAKKAKYQAIKQGMMQELLTGKTRLV